jgi:hypothetical protein
VRLRPSCSHHSQSAVVPALVRLGLLKPRRTSHAATAIHVYSTVHTGPEYRGRIPGRFAERRIPRRNRTCAVVRPPRLAAAKLPLRYKPSQGRCQESTLDRAWQCSQTGLNYAALEGARIRVVAAEPARGDAQQTQTAGRVHQILMKKIHDICRSSAHTSWRAASRPRRLPISGRLPSGCRPRENRRAAWLDPAAGQRCWSNRRLVSSSGQARRHRRRFGAIPDGLRLHWERGIAPARARA